ncbi:MAG: hypothetical protein MK135_04985 [Polyangiaceae bacterium]|nr:hypothetical protein [Polyangiaceae bacterium]
MTDIRELLPHRPPMLLLKELIQVDAATIQCVPDTSATSIFAEKEHLDIIVSLEWMAQAVGAFVGSARIREGRTPQIGFVIGSRRIDYHVDRVDLNAQLIVHAAPLWLEKNSGSFQCSVTRQDCGMVLAEGNLTVYEPEL